MTQNKCREPLNRVNIVHLCSQGGWEQHLSCFKRKVFMTVRFMKAGVNQTVSFFVFVLRLYGDPVHPDWLVTKRETYWTITSNSSITKKTTYVTQKLNVYIFVHIWNVLYSYLNNPQILVISTFENNMKLKLTWISALLIGKNLERLYYFIQCLNGHF